jgi:hypothetical protein
MKFFSASDAEQDLTALLDAAQQEPVVIRRQKQDVAVVLSTVEYDRLRDLNASEFQRFCDRVSGQAAIKGMTENTLNDLLADEG